MSLNPKALEVYMIKKQLSRFYFSKEWSPMTTVMDFSSQSPFFPEYSSSQGVSVPVSLSRPSAPCFFFFNGEITFPV